MTLKNLLTTEGVTTIKWLYVNIIEMITNNHFIVADKSHAAIMVIDEKFQNQVEVGHAIKCLKERCQKQL